MLPDALRERGAEVDVLPLYETVAEPLVGGAARGARASRLRDLHLVLDGHRYFCRRRRRRALDRARLVSIGPVTSAALREHGLEPQTSRPTAHDIDGLVEALLADVEARVS